ncbi:MAG: glutamate 5-kinase [Chloroflexi bacterium]|nr:glutamate 5-kinase [Chloroflexota bacterium]MCI0799249.1 glutamate 5-kinase [Chloroflexota bacterium]MCI0824225.1 glutamate 5-kinase [Chloroflexota bacterium]MCI0879631.1 glutamate 5-kinase [Chloroflexota bacterium]MCI0895139.1 glutamate 5-kinase [Chloroflexota bacterium]
MSRSGQLRSSSVPDRAISAKLRYRRVVVKAGTSVLTRSPGHQSLDLEVMSDLVRQVCHLRSQSAEMLLVTSGAIAAGREALGHGQDAVDRDITSRQVLAAVGQNRLMHIYQELFSAHGYQVAQVLLTINDLSDRQSYLNVRNTLQGLLELGVVPILNENDVVAVDEIGEVFGDNDRLSALVANLVDADLLTILTDTDGLYTADPHLDPDARLIGRVERVDAEIEAVVGTNSNSWARGGMHTKVDAARLVTTSGIAMVMCHGLAKDALLRAVSGEEIGTLFQPAGEKLEARKRWMLSGISHRGEVVVDSGAASAIREDNRSLLPAGIQDARGEFQRGDIIYIVGSEGQRIACGIANYSAEDIQRIRGSRSDQIEGTLGYQYGQEVVHRNNLVLL